MEIQNIDLRGKCEPIWDGIVDIDKYLNAKFKILWILKEPYDEFDGTGGGWGLTDGLSKENLYENKNIKRSPTYQPMIYVTYSILNGFPEWDQMDWIRDNPDIAQSLNYIAYINVKKLPGYTRSDYKELSENYKKNKNLLLKQIKTYDPEIIIFGNTMPLFLSDLKISPEDMKSYNSIKYFNKDYNKIYIDAYHPAQTQITRENYVNDIVNIVKKWSEKKL